ncbi:S8 family serine peptidase [Luteolibacter sp. LG18]|uniref:S8 family serine peptidase n=1 Tax=Luteolibacter sp. LG18 TaxID=2819286 RepID=UPI002B3223E4|nr:hypothetical protein llg_05680 [Luteolibacter sp. LG18]
MKALPIPLLCLLAATATAVAGPARYVEGEVLVTFKPWRDAWSAEQALGKHGLKFSRHFRTLSDLRLKETGLVRDSGRSTAMLIEALKVDPSVETVEPNYLRTVSAVPNDAAFPNLWALQNGAQTVNLVTGTSNADMKYVPARPLYRTPATAPVIGVMDTGMDRLHPDLAANLWVNPGETAGNGIDDDASGKVDDINGFDFVANTNNTADSGYHGTHVAGTIAATGNNRAGVIGDNDLARLMILKVSSDGNYITASAEIAALQYAVLMKSKGVNLVAINASFGGGGFSTTERDAIQAAGTAGIIFCAAAGNDGSNNNTTLTYPASYRLTNMLVVAASDQNDALASFSNYGSTSVDLAAPGVNIYSTAPGGNSGTSGVDSLVTLQCGSTFFSASSIQYTGTGSVSGNLVNCGIGNPADFPPAVNGNIALIQRGTLNFSDKVTNAAAKGAKAVVIYNNVTGTANFTLGSAGTWLPTCAISQADGATLVSTLPTTTVTIGNYRFLDGTSMATPQVSGAVGVAAMCYPEDTVAQRVQRLITAVDVKASLTGKVISNGRLNLQKLVDSDLNGLPDWWEKLYYNQYTGVAPNADTDGDGLTNLNEFLAGTIPTNGQSVLKELSTTRNPANGTATITWASVPGKTYQVYYSPTLAAGSWLATLPSSLVTAGTGQTQMSYTDTTVGAAAKRFYRVTLVVP